MKPITSDYRKFIGDLKSVDVAPKPKEDVEKRISKPQNKVKKGKKEKAYKVPAIEIENAATAVDLFK